MSNICFLSTGNVGENLIWVSLFSRHLSKKGNNIFIVSRVKPEIYFKQPWKRYFINFKGCKFFELYCDRINLLYKYAKLEHIYESEEFQEHIDFSEVMKLEKWLGVSLNYVLSLDRRFYNREKLQDSRDKEVLIYVGKLVKFFKEPRGSFYFFGEVHAVSPDLIPNARRDYFVENPTCQLFEEKLKQKFKQLYELYHLSSRVRSEKKKIEKLASLNEEIKKKSEIGFTKPEEKQEYEKKLQKIQTEAQKAKDKLKKIKSNVSDDRIKSKLMERIVSDIDDNITTTKTASSENTEKPKLLTDNLSKFNKKERKLISKILAIIDNILPMDLSENVKLKIIEELNK